MMDRKVSTIATAIAAAACASLTPIMTQAQSNQTAAAGIETITVTAERVASDL